MPRLLRAAASALAAALAVAPRARAQTIPVSDATLARIWALGMDSSHVAPLLHTLSDSIGPRLTGTPQIRAASAWARATYARWGIPARDERVGSWRGWRRGVTHVDLVQPRLRTLEATLLAWSAGTRERDVTAPVVVFPDVADSAAFERWLPQARGRFVLVSAPQSSCRPDESWERWGMPGAVDSVKRARVADTAAWNARVRRTGLPLGQQSLGALGRRLEQAGAAGIVSSRWSHGWGVNKIFFARNDVAPAIDVSCEDYGLLFRLAERGQGPVLRVRADGELTGEEPTFNTIAEVRGAERPDEYVVLSAHFDSWDAASGTTDNGTGTVVMMEAMRILRAVLPRPKRTILAGHWVSEEQGLNGSRAFVEDHPEVVRGLQALFNQDNGTGRVTRVGAQGLIGGAEAWGRWAARLPTALSDSLQLALGVPSTGGTDHAAFACHGAPTFGLNSLDFDYDRYTWHTNRDTYDKVSLEDVKRNATLVAMLAYLASEDPQTTARTRRVMPAGRAWPECTKAVRRWDDFRR